MTAAAPTGRRRPSRSPRRATAPAGLLATSASTSGRRPPGAVSRRGDAGARFAPGGRRARRAVRRGRARAAPGRRPGPRRAARPARRRPRLRHRRPPRAVLALLSRLGRRHLDVGIAFGTVGARRRGYQLRDHDLPRRRLRPASPQPAVAFGDTLEATSSGATSRSTPWRCALPGAGVRRPATAGWPTWPPACCARPRRREESFDDDPLRMLRAARFASQLGFAVGAARGRGDAAMAGGSARITAERVQVELTKLLLGATRARGAGAARRHRAGRARAARAAGAAAGDRRAPPAQGRLRAHADRAGAGDRAARTDGPDLVLRLAALLHDIGKPATRVRAGRRGLFHHHEVVGAKMTRKRLRALRFPSEVDRGRRPAGRAAPALPRLRRGRLDRLRGAPLRPRRRAAAARLHGARPRGLHHPQPAQGRARCRRRYDTLEERIARLRAQEELARSARPRRRYDGVPALAGRRGRRRRPLARARKRGAATTRPRRSCWLAAEMVAAAAPAPTVPSKMEIEAGAAVDHFRWASRYRSCCHPTNVVVVIIVDGWSFDDLKRLRPPKLYVLLPPLLRQTGRRRTAAAESA